MSGLVSPMFAGNEAIGIVRVTGRRDTMGRSREITDPPRTEEPLMERKMNRAELRAEYRRSVFQVFNGDEWMCSYGDVYFMQPEAPNPMRDYAIQDVIDDLVKDFDDPD
jgi:hypothetical protein